MKHIITGVLVLILVSFVSPLLKAQGQLTSGYIINLQGDTIKGFVNVTDWGMNPSTVHFFENPDSPGRYLWPYDIRMFAIGNDIYEGAMVDVEVSPRDMNNLSSKPELMLEKDQVFLQLLVAGPKSLYVYGKAVYDQYYIKSDSTMELLVYKKYLKDTKVGPGDVRSLVVENKRYHGQLSIYLNDCPDIASAIANTEYDQESLETLFRKYYSCLGSTKSHKVMKPERNVAFTFGFGIGMAGSSIDYDFVNELNRQPVSVTNFIKEATIEISRPLSRPKWSLFNELRLFNSYCHSNQYPHSLSDGTIYTDIYRYDLNSNSLSSMLRYYTNTGKTSFFVNAGLSGTLYSGKYIKEKTSNSMTFPKTFKEEAVRHTSFRVTAGAGYKYKLLSIEVRYQTPGFAGVVGNEIAGIVSFSF